MSQIRQYLLLCLAAIYFLHCAALPISQRNCSNLATEARELLEHENELLRKIYHAHFEASYNHRINLSNNDVVVYNSPSFNLVKIREMAQRIESAGCYNDQFMQRQLMKFLGPNLAKLPKDVKLKLQSAINNMTTNFATATVCEYRNPLNCGLKLDPHVQERMSNSRDPLELAHYWTQWYDAAGTPARDDFSVYVNLSREAASLSNYNSIAEFWIDSFDDPNFEDNVDIAYNDILPLYREIHAYVRYRLRQHHGEDVVTANGNIPMHLLGNIHAVKWHNTIDLYTPYPDKPFVNITAEMLRQGINVTHMFKLGDEFFKSLHMRPLPDSFWNLSVLEHPPNVTMICNAAAWDAFQGSDVRISMCANVDENNLYVVHHELGHIQYVLQYENQPTIFRNAPNPGFHEAVGDTIALFVNSPKHLERIGLLARETFDDEQRINWLFKMALQKIPVLTYAYTLEKWRYAVFRNEIDENSWNCVFWQMLSKFSGLEPPVRRTELDFDPPAKFHISANVEYLRYFAAHIFQFDFHKALCNKAGEYKPNQMDTNLDKCDIYNSKEAGQAFSKFLSLGQSKHWKQTLEEFTGETTMNAAALIEYFKPLQQWLQLENKRLGVPIGWVQTDKAAKDCLPLLSNIDNLIAYKM